MKKLLFLINAFLFFVSPSFVFASDNCVMTWGEWEEKYSNNPISVRQCQFKKDYNGGSLSQLDSFDENISMEENTCLEDVEYLGCSWGGDENKNSLEGTSFFTNLIYLKLWQNEITSIRKGDLNELKNLKELNVSDNKITAIESGAFQNLYNLEKLSLGKNNITTIDSGDFEGLDNVKEIDLIGNSITFIDSESFDGLNNLETLNLRGNPDISFSSGVIRFLQKVENLEFEYRGMIFFQESFPDVYQTTPFNEAIHYVKEKGYMNGFEDGNFYPDHQISRYEFIKIITSLMYSEEKIKECDIQKDLTFPDVPKDDWFSYYVCIAERDGIINGYADGTFGGINNVTNAEVLKQILPIYRYTIYGQCEPTSVYFPEIFRNKEFLKENNKKENWYKLYIDAANGIEWGSGYKINLVFDEDNPHYIITREEVAEMIRGFEQDKLSLCDYS